MIRWSPDWHEVIPPGEAEYFAKFAQDIGAIAHEVARRTHAPVGRVFHIKKHTGVVGELRVLPNLPAPLASGVFAAPRTFPCFVRFSNGAVRKQLDGIFDVRGAALKLVGVPGAKLLPGHEHDVTQDFLFVQTPAVPTDSPEEFLALAQSSIGGPLLLPLKLAHKIGFVRAAQILLRLAMVPQPASIANATFFNAVPIRFGPAAAKLSLVPVQRATRRRGHTLRDDVISRLRNGPLTWRMRAQLYTDERRTPIESASREWQGDFHDVGVLDLAMQDCESTGGREVDARIDTLSFDPWHAIADHRPLGATQRARVAAYEASRRQRGAAAEPIAIA